VDKALRSHDGLNVNLGALNRANGNPWRAAQVWRITVPRGNNALVRLIWDSSMVTVTRGKRAGTRVFKQEDGVLNLSGIGVCFATTARTAAPGGHFVLEVVPCTDNWGTVGNKKRVFKWWADPPACAAGQFGAVGDNCANCDAAVVPVDQYCPEGTPTNNGVACPDNQYRASTSADLTQCSPCAAGQFGVGDVGNCAACNAANVAVDWYCPRGTPTAQGVPCPDGQQRADLADFTRC
jgi:hypothetical protein